AKREVFMRLRKLWSLAAVLVPLLLISVAASTSASYAEDQSAPAAAVPAAPPACDAKTLEACTPNSGDTAWMLTSMALVLMMTVPGLGLFYGGMVRKK